MIPNIQIPLTKWIKTFGTVLERTTPSPHTYLNPPLFLQPNKYACIRWFHLQKKLFSDKNNLHVHVFEWIFRRSNSVILFLCLLSLLGKVLKKSICPLGANSPHYELIPMRSLAKKTNKAEILPLNVYQLGDKKNLYQLGDTCAQNCLLGR